MANKKVTLDKKDNRQIEELHLISGETLESIHNVMRAFVISFGLAYKENEWVRIPYFGDIFVKYLGDEETDEGNETEVSVLFEPHPSLRRLVGQIEDEEATGDHTRNDAYKLLMHMVKHSLRETVTD